MLLFGLFEMYGYNYYRLFLSNFIYLYKYKYDSKVVRL